MWNELTFLWNDLTTDWNDLTWNDLTMERNDRIPSKTCYYKPRPICLRLLTTVKPNIFERKGPSLGKHTIVVWVFHCYESSLMSSSHFT